MVFGVKQQSNILGRFSCRDEKINALMWLKKLQSVVNYRSLA